MADVETLEERVRTVERAVTDGDHDAPAMHGRPELEARVEAVEKRLEDIDDRTAELEAATQALRGYVGNVRSVNESVEQRADSALAAVDRLERRLDDAPDGTPASDGPPAGPPADRERVGEHGGSTSTQERGETRQSAERGRNPRGSRGRPDTPKEPRRKQPRDGQSGPVAFHDGRSEQSDEQSESGLLERLRALL